nr:uncharacterized protein LOC6628481 [Drosophila virilis]
MPRMPMNAVAATPQLLLLLMLLAMSATQSFARSARTTVAPDAISEEETTYAGAFEANTVTIAVDSDIILTTEDGMQAFTQLSDYGHTTTEEPLPDSVLQQLARERAEREQNSTTNATTTAEEPNLSEKLISHNKTLTKTAITTQKTKVSPTGIPTTTEISTEDTTATENTEQLVGRSGLSHSAIVQHMDTAQSTDDLLMEEVRQQAYIERALSPDLTLLLTTEKTAMLAASDDVEEITSLPLMQMDLNTSGPLPFEAISSGTDSMRLEQTTWMENPAELMGSTTEADTLTFMTTTQQGPDDDPQLETVTKEVKYHSNENLLSGMNSDIVTQNVKMQPELELSATAEPQVELTTATVATESNTIAGTDSVAETTIAPPKEQSMLTATRAPRIERIFNSDGVEVLYGYSSVVRTNRS